MCLVTYYHGTPVALPAGTLLTNDHPARNKGRKEGRVWATTKPTFAKVYGEHVYEVTPVGPTFKGAGSDPDRDHTEFPDDWPIFYASGWTIVREVTPSEMEQFIRERDERVLIEDAERAARRTAALRIGPHTFWRVHPPGRSWADATSTQFHPHEGPGQGTRDGFSCFSNPWTLWAYIMTTFGGAIAGSEVVGFQGIRIGTGHDGEDLAYPTTAGHLSYTPNEFYEQLLSTPMPRTPAPVASSWSAFCNMTRIHRDSSPQAAMVKDFVEGNKQSEFEHSRRIWSAPVLASTKSYYHGTQADLPEGTVLVPAGERGGSNYDHLYTQPGEEWRSDWVWISTDPDDAKIWSRYGPGGSYVPNSGHVYEVVPEGEVVNGCRAQRARIVRKVSASSASDPTMDPSFAKLRETRSIDGIDYRFSTKDGGAFSTGAFVQAIQGGKPVGHINIGWQGWSPQGFVIQWVEVGEDHQRQGIASNMLALAREHLAPYGGVRHDTALSPSGRPWSEHVGVTAGWDDPETQRRLEELAEILTTPTGKSYDPIGDLGDPHAGYGGYISQDRNGRLILDGKPVKKLYRVVDPAEWAAAQAQGALQSHEGYTRASAAPDDRWRYQGAPGVRGLTLEITYDPADRWHASAEGYAATHQPIPLSRVRKVGAKVRYYHGSKADLPVGTVLVPGGPNRHPNDDYWGSQDVWLTTKLESAEIFAEGGFIYEVEPDGLEGGIAPNEHIFWCKSATIIARVDGLSTEAASGCRYGHPERIAAAEHMLEQVKDQPKESRREHMRSIANGALRNIRKAMETCPDCSGAQVMTAAWGFQPDGANYDPRQNAVVPPDDLFDAAVVRWGGAKAKTILDGAGFTADGFTYIFTKSNKDSIPPSEGEYEMEANDGGGATFRRSADGAWEYNSYYGAGWQRFASKLARRPDSDRSWTKDTYALESLQMRDQEPMDQKAAEALVNKILNGEGIPYKVKFWAGGGKINQASSMWDWATRIVGNDLVDDYSANITYGSPALLVPQVVVHEAAHLVNQWLHDNPDGDATVVSDGHGPKWQAIYARLAQQYLGESPWAAAGYAGISMTAALQEAFREQGRYAERSHITMEERGTIPTEVLAKMPGQMGEVPGDHRNKKGEKWEAFKADLTANGMREGIFICITPGEQVRIWEGNHRRDAAVEMGWDEVPVVVRYTGLAEQDGTLMERYARGGNWMAGYKDTERIEREERERSQRWGVRAVANAGRWTKADIDMMPGDSVRRRPGLTQWIIKDFSDPRMPVVGAIGFRETTDKVTIEALQVNPDYRRQGVGTLLLQALIDYAGYYQEVDPGKFTPEGAKLWKAVTGEDVKGTERMPGANDAARYAAVSAPPKIRLYHGTNHAAAAAIRRSGQFRAISPEETAHEVERRYGLAHNSVWQSKFNDFSRGRSLDPLVYLSGNRETAADYARIGGEVLFDALTAAYYEIHGEESTVDRQEWVRAETAKHYEPVVLTLDVPFDAFAKAQADQWKRAKPVDGHEVGTYEWWMAITDGEPGNTETIKAPFPASWIVNEQKVSSLVLTASQEIYYHGTPHELPRGTILLPADSGKVTPNHDYGDRPYNPLRGLGQFVHASTTPREAREWGEMAAGFNGGGPTYVYAIKPMGQVIRGSDPRLDMADDPTVVAMPQAMVLYEVDDDGGIKARAAKAVPEVVERERIFKALHGIESDKPPAMLQNVLRRILRTEGVEGASFAVVRTSQQAGGSHIGVDLNPLADEDEPWIVPVVYLHPRMHDMVTLLHEAAHLIELHRAGLLHDADGFDESRVHGAGFEAIFERLLRGMYGKGLPAKTAGPGSGVIPDRVRADAPANPQAPRRVTVNRTAESDIRDLPDGDEKIVRRMLKAIERGGVPLERKSRYPLNDCFTADASRSLRIAMFPHIDGSWQVFYVGYHDYDEAERRMASNEVPASTPIRRSKVRNIDTDRLSRRREFLRSLIKDRAGELENRIDFVWRAAELHAIETELESRGELPDERITLASLQATAALDVDGMEVLMDAIENSTPVEVLYHHSPGYAMTVKGVPVGGGRGVLKLSDWPERDIAWDDIISVRPAVPAKAAAMDDAGRAYVAEGVIERMGKQGPIMDEAEIRSLGAEFGIHPNQMHLIPPSSMKVHHASPTDHGFVSAMGTVFINAQYATRLTVLHEIAHWLVRHEGHFNEGHGPIWQQRAADLYRSHLDPEAADRFESLMGLRAEGARIKPLPMGEGIFYRLQGERPFDPMDATSTPLVSRDDAERMFGKEHADRWFDTKQGYSAFANPEHVRQYVEAMDWDKGKVVAFRGTVIGSGLDDEPLVQPEGGPIETISWDDFEMRIEVTPGAHSYPDWESSADGGGRDYEIPGQGPRFFTIGVSMASRELVGAGS